MQISSRCFPLLELTRSHSNLRPPVKNARSSPLSSCCSELSGVVLLIRCRCPSFEHVMLRSRAGPACVRRAARGRFRPCVTALPRPGLRARTPNTSCSFCRLLPMHYCLCMQHGQNRAHKWRSVHEISTLLMRGISGLHKIAATVEHLLKSISKTFQLPSIHCSLHWKVNTRSPFEAGNVLDAWRRLCVVKRRGADVTRIDA